MVMVALLPQLPRWYVSRVAARNPGNAECGDLDHSTMSGGRGGGGERGGLSGKRSGRQKEEQRHT